MRELTNPFDVSIKRKMFVYPNAHKHCEGKCKCRKEEIWVKFPNILQTQENDYCQKHNLSFTNEQHKLPSGKIRWLGCPTCQIKLREIANMRSMELYMKDNGMRYNLETKEWFKPISIEKPSANDDYRDVRSLGYKD